MRHLVSRVVWFGSLIAISAAVIPLLAQQNCGSCQPGLENYVTDVGGHYRVCMVYGFTQTERDNYKIGIETYWPEIMATTGTPVTFEVFFADDEPEFLCGPFEPDIIVDYADLGTSGPLGETQQTTNGVGAVITLNIRYLSDYYGTGETAERVWQWNAGHEIGHVLGFNNVTTSGCQPYTIMATDWSPVALPSMNCGDVAAALVKYPKRDYDNDGYSPDDDPPDEDCDDWDDQVHPNLIPTCDVGMDDRNCNNVPDIYECQSPIVIDMTGNGFRLTNLEQGVAFDLDGDGVAQQLPWIAQGSDDAWLALDRSGNGRIDNGQELFGNFTAQPPTAHPNGFTALEVFDKIENGGNSNGLFDEGDRSFSKVVLWHDANHDGVSQAVELRPVGRAGIRAISLDFRESQRRDEWGNWFRYRAQVLDGRGRDVGKFAWDVFLNAAPKPSRRGSIGR